ncbi:ribokinase [Janthinobacterium sp. CG_23.3]|uniref:carbohydrate kinase family protein n=1 Tax=Janthinobacterium sp. CG_23.3 TaxID=3349634 RepID=UPI0038D49F03
MSAPAGTGAAELLVAGLAYFEVHVPAGAPPQPGEERFVSTIGLGFGGALNSASVAAALGLRVALCVPAGAGVADHALALLARRLGIALTALPCGDNPAISLVYASADERAFLSAADFTALERVETLPPARWIHVPGLEEAARLAAPLARARGAGAQVAVSGSWTPARLAALTARRDCPWDLLVLNDKEAHAACGDVAEAPRHLAGAARSVLVTQGAQGAFGTLNGYGVRLPAAALAVCDPTGAGDAFCAGLLAALIRGAAPEPALRLAGAAAGHILQQRGGVLDDPARIALVAKEMRWIS